VASGEEYVSFKDALGLPDSLPPIRLPPLAELAAQARDAPLTARLAALAGWVGEEGRSVGADGDLTAQDLVAARDAFAMESDEDLAYLWEYALFAEWVGYAAGTGDRVVPGVAARAWAGGDESVFVMWSGTLAAVLSGTIAVSGPADPGELAELGLDELVFAGQPLALAVLLFLSRRQGLSLTEFTGMFWDGAAGDMPEPRAAAARTAWITRFGDPVGLLLGKLADLDAVTMTGDVIRLTPLGLAALHKQLAESGVDIPLLPPTSADLTGAQLIALARGITEEEFEAESGAWVAARDPGAAAGELLRLAAHAEPGERLLAIAAVTRIGAAAEPAWRDSLDVPQVRAYAKAGLAELAEAGGGTAGAELEQSPADVAWMATDVLSLTCDDKFPDPDDLAVSFRETVPPGGEDALFDAMWRCVHPDAVAVLNHVGRYHPDAEVAQAARTAAHNAASGAR
jgi:hypothetical protein